MKVLSMRVLFVCGLLAAHTGPWQTVAIAQSPNGSKAQSPTVPAPIGDPLLRLLVSKGVLTTEDAAVVLSSGNPAQQRDRLPTLLKDKGLISNSEFYVLQNTSSAQTPDGNANVNATPWNSKASSGPLPAGGGPKPVAFPSFAFEQGYYRTRAANRSALDVGGLPLFRGIPSYTSHNVRSEFATIFTF